MSDVPQSTASISSDSAGTSGYTSGYSTGAVAELASSALEEQAEDEDLEWQRGCVSPHSSSLAAVCYADGVIRLLEVEEASLDASRSDSPGASGAWGKISPRIIFASSH